MLTVDVIDRLEEFRALEKEWNVLVDRYAAASVMLTHEWLMAYAEMCRTERSLRVITVRDGTALIGAAPLLLETIKWRGLPVRQLVLMSHPISNNVRSDFVVPERRENVLQVIATHLHRTRHEWDVCVFDSLPDCSQALPLLPAACRLAGLLVREPECYWMLHYVPIKGIWDEYLASFSNKTRVHLRREEREFGRLGKTSTIFLESPQEVGEGIEAYFDIESKSHKQNKPDYTPLDERTRTYLRELFHSLARVKHALIGLVRVDDRVAAVMCATRYRGKTVLGLCTVYDPEFERGFPGHLVRKALLKYGWEHGYERVDMNGYGWHLQRWGTIGQACYRLFIYSPSVYGRFLYAVREFILPTMRKVAPFVSFLASRSQATRPGDRGIEP